MSDSFNTVAAIAGKEAGSVDRTALGLAYQKDLLAAKATGAALGHGQRISPDPNVQFSNPPMSAAQFQQSRNARGIANFNSVGRDEDEEE